MNRPVNLFCIPFAGGSKYSFTNFEASFPAGIRVKAIDFPGRGARIKEKLLHGMDDLVDDAFRQIHHLLTQPYALFGHSMGGMICYLLALKIREYNLHPPIHLFVSGTPGPSTRNEESTDYMLEKNEFLKKVRDLGGLPPELLENNEMLDFFEPILRADFRAIDTYKYQPAPPLNTAITVMKGIDEDLAHFQVIGWQRESVCPIELIQLPGNHFFIYDHVKTIGNIIDRKLHANLV